MPHNELISLSVPLAPYSYLFFFTKPSLFCLSFFFYCKIMTLICYSKIIGTEGWK